MLTGEVGTGKTTLCRHLLSQIPENVDMAVLVNPRLGIVDLLNYIFDELGLQAPADSQNLRVLLASFNNYLLETEEKGRHTVILIDEAQNLSVDALEHLRLLTNIETDSGKLLKIILVGQPELNTLLSRKDMRQLDQRITARYHLLPLSYGETLDYIHHRLTKAGGDKSIFPDRVIRKIHRYSGGTPRLINALCDRALMGCYVADTMQVNKEIIAEAAHEVIPRRFERLWLKYALPVIALILTFLSGGAVFYLMNQSLAETPGLVQSSDVDLPAIDAGDTSLSVGLQPIDVELGAALDDAEPRQSTAPLVGPLPPTLNSKEELAEADLAVVPHNNEVIHASKFTEIITDSNLDRVVALGHLARQWGLNEFSSLGDICSIAKLNELRCMIETADWDELRLLNRPAILKLKSQRGRERYITLVGLEGAHAIVALADDTKYAFPIDEISRFWNGEYSLFWKPPSPNTSLIAPGAYSPSVRWIREKLGERQAVSSAADNPDYYNNTLKLSVTAYQQSHGLFPDGIVGMRTVILLNNSANTPNIPRLYIDDASGGV